MKVKQTDTCGNSPRSKQAMEIAIWLASNDYASLEALLADDFVWKTPHKASGITKSQLRTFMSRTADAEIAVVELSIDTAFSHGKFAAVSSQSTLSGGKRVFSHDLYEFTSAGASAKLLKVVSYIVDAAEPSEL